MYVIFLISTYRDSKLFLYIYNCMWDMIIKWKLVKLEVLLKSK